MMVSPLPVHQPAVPSYDSFPFSSAPNNISESTLFSPHSETGVQPHYPSPPNYPFSASVSTSPALSASASASASASTSGQSGFISLPVTPISHSPAASPPLLSPIPLPTVNEFPQFNTLTSQHQTRPQPVHSGSGWKRPCLKSSSKSSFSSSSKRVAVSRSSSTCTPAKAKPTTTTSHHSNSFKSNNPSALNGFGCSFFSRTKPLPPPPPSSPVPFHRGSGLTTMTTTTTPNPQSNEFNPTSNRPIELTLPPAYPFSMDLGARLSTLGNGTTTRRKTFGWAEEWVEDAVPVPGSEEGMEVDE